MSLSSLVLKFATPIPDIEKFDSYLFVGPHPDDIEIGAGATAAKLVSMGKSVSFVVCTDGRFGDENISPNTSRDELIAIRQSEAIKSAKALGVENIYFLGFSDGGFYDKAEMLKALAKLVGKIKPDVVFAPDPYVSSECHADHINVGNISAQVAYFSLYPAIMKEYGANPSNVKALAYYMTAKPNKFVKTSGFVVKQLKAIFENHLSQFPIGCTDAKSISLYIKLRSFDFGIRSFNGQAEGFRVLGRVHMHCLPEAGK